MNKSRNKIEDKNIKIFYILIFLIGFIVRLYKLDGLPTAIHIDEAGLWYNVKCLINYGTDQAGNSYPLLFSNFYGEQSAMYVYLALICCKLFGDSLFSIRLPALMGWVITFIFGLKIVKKLYNNKTVSILYCIFITFLPYFIVNCRIALDCNLMLPFSTIFLWFLLKAMDTEMCQDYVVAGICGGLVFYTYAISYITIPLFVAITGIYLIIHKKITVKNAIVFLLPIILLGTPLLIVQLINMFDWNTILVGKITLPKFEASRHTELHTITATSCVSNIFKFIALSLFGDVISLKTSVFCSNFYIVLIPFVCFGAFQMFHEVLSSKTFTSTCIFTNWIVAMLITLAVVGQGLHAYQANALMFCLTLSLICGLKKNIQQPLTKLTKVLLIVFLICSLICLFVIFDGSYNSACSERDGYFYDLTEVVEHLEKNQKTYFLVPQVYYKLTTNESPDVHPFYFNATVSSTGIKYEEIVYPYENGFEFYGINFVYHKDAIYVIPNKNIIIEELKRANIFEENYNIVQIDNYIVIKPQNLD